MKVDERLPELLERWAHNSDAHPLCLTRDDRRRHLLHIMRGLAFDGDDDVAQVQRTIGMCRAALAPSLILISEPSRPY